MKKINIVFSLMYKGIRKCYLKIRIISDKLICLIIMYGNRVEHENFTIQGIPYLSVAIGGKFKIGNNLKINNKISSNPIGCAQPCIFFVDKNAQLIIGNRVSLSQTALVCHSFISIGDDVKMGGGVCVYDTDFHSLDSKLRMNINSDFINKKKSPVVIENNVFIGAHSIILKGVTIGENSIIGAGSIITKSIPANEIWGGNPAKKIKDLPS